IPTTTAAQLTRMALSAQAADADSELCEWLVTISSGNPFFIHSLVLHYSSTGQRFAVPPTLEGLLRHRIAGVRADARVVLHACIVLGKHSTVKRLCETIEISTATLFASIRELETARLLVEEGNHVSVQHALIAERVLHDTSPLALATL